MNNVNGNGYIYYWSWNGLYICSGIIHREALLNHPPKCLFHGNYRQKSGPKVTFQWHKTHFTNLKNVFLPTEFLWSSTISHVSLTRYFWAGVRGITADFSVGLWEDDPQPMLVTSGRHLYEVQKVELKDDIRSAKKISIALANWQRFHMTCLTPVLVDILQNYFVLGD